MITEAHGNLLDARVDALVNTVNTEGVMGKGIALQFKKAFPSMFKVYATAAKQGEVRLGHMHVWRTEVLDGPQYVINFPTKAHWRAKSRLADIESGLQDLVAVVRDLGISSIAIPPLGCGNGGLKWSDVRPRIWEAFDSLPGVDVQVFPPAGAPNPTEMRANEPTPKMTAGRAALVGIVDRYMVQALNAPSLVETQKLMYFMQVVGEELRLKFEPNRYGPYADNLRHVLAAVEGHYLIGYGDGSSKVLDGAPLEPAPGAVALSNKYLGRHPETSHRMEKVLALAEGYESAYGMELLATVHWAAWHTAGDVTVDSVAAEVADWSPRKARMFTRTHVESALSALSRHGLLPPEV